MASKCIAMQAAATATTCLRAWATLRHLALIPFPSAVGNLFSSRLVSSLLVSSSRLVSSPPVSSSRLVHPPHQPHPRLNSVICPTTNHLSCFIDILEFDIAIAVFLDPQLADPTLIVTRAYISRPVTASRDRISLPRISPLSTAVRMRRTMPIRK